MQARPPVLLLSCVELDRERARGLTLATSTQVADEEYRAEPARPAATMLYTADNLTTGQALAADLLTSPTIDNSALLANVTALFSQGLNMVREPIAILSAVCMWGGSLLAISNDDLLTPPMQTPAVINADALSLLGYDLGTAALPDIQDYFLDKAFTGDQVRTPHDRSA